MTEKVYLENPYLRQIEARVIEKKFMNNKYYLKTNKTIFYPNLAGGQPGDKGTINGIEVLEVYEDGDDIIHVLEDDIYSDKVKMKIDWNTRFDYMQQHSGQHLLSSVFYKLHNGETTGFHIGKDYVYIIINIPQISKEEIERVETFANKIVFSNFLIKSYIVEKKDINKFPVRKEPKINSNIRIVEIDEIDFSPCCGTHVRSTGEIGIIKIRNVQSYKGNIRVEFVCGFRALRDYSWKNEAIKHMSNLLSVKDIDIKSKVEKLYMEKEKLEKENKKLKNKLYKYDAINLLNNSKIQNGIHFVIKKFPDENFQYILNISNVLNSYENTISILAVEKENNSQFIVSANNNININLNKILDTISKNITIKGGGRPKAIQGSCNKKDLDKIMNMFYDKIKKAINL